MYAIGIQTLFFSGCIISSSTALKFSAIIYVKYLTLIDYENFKNRPQILLFWLLKFRIETGSVRQSLPVCPRKSYNTALSRYISHFQASKSEFIGINMFKRYIVDFSKNLENSDFLKMRKNLIS